MARICQSIAAHAIDKGIEVVAGPAIGAVALSFLIAYFMNLELDGKGDLVVPVYSTPGVDNTMEFKRGHDKFIPGKKLLVAEDILSSGGSAKRVVRAARKLGGHVVGVTAMCNRGGVTTDDVGHPPWLWSQVNINMPMTLADECEDCKNRIPINQSVGKGTDYLKEKAQGTDDFAAWYRSQLH
ncbi:MAG: phosphoribosyltransferase [Patescibacteria group bacterium]